MMLDAFYFSPQLFNYVIPSYFEEKEYYALVLEAISKHPENIKLFNRRDINIEMIKTAVNKDKNYISLLPKFVSILNVL